MTGVTDARSGPFRRGGKPGPLGRQLATALRGRRISEADEVLVLMARSAADAADHAKTVQDVKVYTAQAKWLRQLMKDLGLLDVDSVEAREEEDDGDDDLGAIIGSPSR